MKKFESAYQNVKQRLLPLLLLVIVIYIGIASSFGQLVQRDDNPDDPSPLDAVIDQTKAGDFLLFSRLSTIDQGKIIRRLKDRIPIQDGPDEPRSLAVGKLLVQMDAEEPLHNLIVALSKEYFGLSREIAVTFNALSFMKSKAAIRVLASFLDDKDELVFQKQLHQLEKLKQKKRLAYLGSVYPFVAFCWIARL